jgi:glutathione S-transferase
MLKLYYIPAACSLASHIALLEARADFEVEEIDYARGDHKDPKFLQLNPKGFVPVLLTEQGPITENVAILFYVAMRFSDAGLYPSSDPFGFARMQEFNTFLSASVHVTYRHISRPRLFADGAEAAAALRAKVPEMVHRYFGLIEDKFHDGRTWVHGERYTVSDPYLFVYSSYLQWGDRGDSSRFPRVCAHRERFLPDRPHKKLSRRKEFPIRRLPLVQTFVSPPSMATTLPAAESELRSRQSTLGMTSAATQRR